MQLKLLIKIYHL